MTDPDTSQQPIAEEHPADDPVPQWQRDLDNVGFVRKLFRARKWHGGDWWFVVISALLLLFVITVGVFPTFFASYDPRAEVGPSLLAPGETESAHVLIVRSDSGIEELRDIALPTNNIGFVVGTPSSHVLREAINIITDEDRVAGIDIRYQPRPRRYETLEEGLAALAAGESDGFIISSDELDIAIEEYPELDVVAGGLPGQVQTGFTFGTNQIGQDVLSRIIHGTSIALVVGITSALVAVLIGVPLGLFSAFTGGRLDRGMTMMMDAMYAFPGLILAIAIAAVLGPGIGNIIVAIAVVYIPTYFRIVRGQVLQVKQELYVEAARSLGAKAHTILTRYIFPNVIPSIVVIFSVNVADAILTEAGLSFLGLGLPPDTPDWGIDLARGQDYVRRAWWMTFFPGAMVTLVTLSFSMLGESLSEILNPKLSEQ